MRNKQLNLAKSRNKHLEKNFLKTFVLYKSVNLNKNSIILKTNSIVIYLKIIFYFTIKKRNSYIR